MFEFPIREVSVTLPLWLTALPHDHWLRKALFGAVASAANEMELVRDVSLMTERLKECEYTDDCSVSSMDLGCGSANISVRVGSGLFYKVLSESTGLTVENEQSLMATMRELASVVPILADQSLSRYRRCLQIADQAPRAVDKNAALAAMEQAKAALSARDIAI